MLTKIKEFFRDSANLILAIVVALVGGIVYYLSNKLHSANYKVGQLESDKAMSKILTLKEEAADDANKKELEYIRARDSFLNDDSDGGSDH